jgi:hypothetical protein
VTEVAQTRYAKTLDGGYIAYKLREVLVGAGVLLSVEPPRPPRDGALG